MNMMVKFEDTPFVEVELNGKIQLGVNARELHAMLQVKSDFSHWINRRIKQCKFEENFDFVKRVKKDELSRTGQTLIEYIISVDMTKHLGMMERNDKGHDIRKYFIEQEEIARNAVNGIQVEIGKLSMQIDQITASLSAAASFLSVGGKQAKPAMVQMLGRLKNQVQHKINFDSDKGGS